jgi:predicted polyphosphate/ATP-dependent NAD kinase
MSVDPARSAAKAALRAGLHSSPGLRILTGGQTGVDTIAALAALRAGLPVHVLFPRGFRQEDGALTGERRRELDGAELHELASAEFRDRTWACVSESDAVVLIDPAGGDGCKETAVAARELGRPLLAVTGPTGVVSGSAAGGRGPADAAEVAAWLAETGARMLMIAGCRGSLLAAAGCRELAESQIATVIFVARQRHDQLVA